MDRGSENAKADRNPPHGLVAALDVIESARTPAAKEAAELVTEKHQPPKHRHVFRAENIAHQRARQRNSPEPKEPEARRKQQDRRTRKRQDKKHREGQGAQRIQQREHILLQILAAEPTPN